MATLPIKSEQHYRRERRVQLTLMYLLLLVVVLISLYPPLMMLINSFKGNSEININPGGLPQHVTSENYQQIGAENSGVVIAGVITLFVGTLLALVLTKYTFPRRNAVIAGLAALIVLSVIPLTVASTGLLRNFLNTIIVATITTIFAVFFSALAGFAFAKYRFPGRNVLFVLLLATIMVPTAITLPPQYLIFAQLNWIDTYQVQIIPFLTPVFGLFLIRQYMLTIPDSLIEAARIDGANDWLIFWRIIMPVASPVLAVFGIIHFLNMWNSYIWPQVMANDPSVAPLMLILPNLRDPVIGFLPVWGTIMAGCVLATLPILVLFLTNQDKFMSGLIIGATKE
jgi:ABC-type glycerol-3-phosphate transport system permease component